MDALHEHINRWTMKEHGNVEHFCGIDQYSLCSSVSVGSKNALDLLVDMGQVRASYKCSVHSMIGYDTV